MTQPRRSGSASLRVTLALLVQLLWFAAPGAAQDAAQGAPPPAPTITELRVEQEGQPLTEPGLLSLIETTVGKPLSMVDVRESRTHLAGLNRFEDVEVVTEPTPGGVRLIYRLVPLRPIDKVEFRGRLGLPEGRLRAALRERFGASPSANRINAAIGVLQQTYRDNGYASPQISTEIVPRTHPDRATLVVMVDSGPRSMVKEVIWTDEDTLAAGTVVGHPDVRAGELYDHDKVERTLRKYVDTMRRNGFYEARTDSTPIFQPDGVVLQITVRRGPRVNVVFAGDPLTRAEQQRLVPVRAEASVDEDLLENSTIAIEDYLRTRGYRDARAPHMRTENNGELTITFDVTRGPRYVVDRVELTGEMSIPEMELRSTLRFKPGESFVESVVDAGAYAMGQRYLDRGFNTVKVTPAYEIVEPETSGEAKRVRITLAVDEGNRNTVQSVTFSGNSSVPDTDLRMLVGLAPGDPLSQRKVGEGIANIETRYRDLGFPSVHVETSIGRAGDAANVQFSVTEGMQVFVDRIIVEGNERTSETIIQRELLIHPGEPLGATARAESETRLKELGLFRRVRIDERRHLGDDRVDLIIHVEEAKRTTLSWGPGLEISSRLRPTGLNGAAEERLEFVPRGFFEIGRRNMWGKNRSVNLFTRVSARAQDTEVAPGVLDSSYGINEYRVFGTFREPKVLGTAAEGVLTGIAERAIRTSYSFESKEMRAEVGGPTARFYSASVRFSVKKTRLFDVNLTDEEKPLIDRLFPQVRLSKIATSLIRNTRDNELDPVRGTFMSADSEVAARLLGSEVGFVKTLVQMAWYRQMPTQRRTVLALRGVIGAAHGFGREVPLIATPSSDGNGVETVEVVQDLPASERFFAGGSTSNRGFSSDRLGSADTLSPSGFPTGGNGELLLNGEVRVSLFSAIAGVAFVDIGNIFKYASDIRLTELRPAAGGGLHYRSPFGPVRVEAGFNLDRREIAPGQLERGFILHISLGPAF